MMKKATQRIRHVRTEDGVQLAWAEAGIVKEGVSLPAGSGYIGETPVEFAAAVLKRGKELASLTST
jgi:hypothetical protein